MGGTNPITIDGITIDFNEANQAHTSAEPRHQYLDTSDVIIKNCTLIGGQSGVRCDRVDGFMMTETEAYNHIFYGAVLYGCTNFRVNDNYLHDNDFAGAAFVSGGNGSCANNCYQ